MAPIFKVEHLADDRAPNISETFILFDLFIFGNIKIPKFKFKTLKHIYESEVKLISLFLGKLKIKL